VKYQRLGELLLTHGLLTQEQLERALEIQQSSSYRLGKILNDLNFLSANDIIQVLQIQLGVPYVDLSKISVEATVATLIPMFLAERHQVIPIETKGNTITLAMVDPTNFYAIDDVRMVSGYDVEAVIATEQDVLREIRSAYGVQDLVNKAVNQIRPEELQANKMQTADDAPIISLVNSLISQAIKDRASDIHIEPQDNILRIRFRIDGILRDIVSFPHYIHAAIVARIKIMGDMDLGEKRLPQDGRIQMREAQREVDLRVSTLPTIMGEKIVMRLLDQQAVILDIHQLGFSSTNIEQFQQLYSQSYGMLLVTGPTGSGKTTTLYSTLIAVNSSDKNIITLEDPVEYRLPGINQVQVNAKAGLTFAHSLRSILRQDPNVILVGEIRDGETADIAIRASLTGHIVFSTLHTNDAAGSITRLLEMGIEPFLVASSVLGVVAQRLVRILCKECKQGYNLPLKSSERRLLNASPDEAITLYRRTGCSRCHHSGYRGRMAIHEIMSITPQLREAIQRKATADEIAHIASSQGMITLRQDGIQKARAGLTDLQEVIRVANIDHKGVIYG